MQSLPSGLPDHSQKTPIQKSYLQKNYKASQLKSKVKALSSEILKTIETNKENLSKQSYRVAIQTVQGIDILLANKEKLKRETLTKHVYELTGMSIHAAENYPNVESFIKGIKRAVNVLQKAYGNAGTDDEKLRLIRHGLGEGGGCFEARVETLYHFLGETETLQGLLKYEIMELNIRNQRPKFDPVQLHELIEFLQKQNFFERHHLDSKTIISELQGHDLIASDKPKDPLTIINETFSTYEGFGAGEEAFLAYLETILKDRSKDDLKRLLEKYFKQYTERKNWL